MAIDAEIASESLDVVGQQLPLGEILAEVLAQAQKVLPFWRRAIAPVSAPGWRGLRGVCEAVRGFFRKPGAGRGVQRRLAVWVGGRAGAARTV